MNNSEKIDNLNKLIRENSINDVISFIKESGVNVNDYSINHNINGEFPLQCAVYFNKYEIVNYLLQNGANVNQKDVNGENSLFISFNSLPDKRMINILLSYNIEFGNIFKIIKEYELRNNNPKNLNILSIAKMTLLQSLRSKKLKRILI